MNTPGKALITTAIAALAVTACSGESPEEAAWRGCIAYEVSQKLGDPDNYTGPSDSIKWPRLSEVTVQQYETGAYRLSATIQGRTFVCRAQPEASLYNTSWS